MGILDKVYHFFFRDKQDNLNFDLNDLKENLRKIKEKESKKKPVVLKNKENHEEIDKGDSVILREVKWVPDPLITFGKEYVKSQGLQDPLLLGVKMFLAEQIYLINKEYEKKRHTCTHFAQEVQDAATQYGIRCGVTAINFKNSQTGHAIVAFKTDYGLKFFEPQNGEEQDVIIGRRYSATSSGFSDDNVISNVEIFWNDGTHKIIE